MFSSDFSLENVVAKLGHRLRHLLVWHERMNLHLPKYRHTRQGGLNSRSERALNRHGRTKILLHDIFNHPNTPPADRPSRRYEGCSRKQEVQKAVETLYSPVCRIRPSKLNNFILDPVLNWWLPVCVRPCVWVCGGGHLCWYATELLNWIQASHAESSARRHQEGLWQQAAFFLDNHRAHFPFLWASTIHSSVSPLFWGWCLTRA